MRKPSGTSMRSGDAAAAGEGYRWLAIVFATLIVFVLQFQFRWLDDNHTVNWNWAFSGRDLLTIVLVLAAALLVASPAAAILLRTRAAPALVVGLAFATGAWNWPQPELIIDTARYFLQAKQLAAHGVGYFLGQWGGEIWAWTDLPLVSFLYGTAFALAGESRLVVQTLTTAMFAATVGLTYLLGTRLWGRASGLQAALMLLAMPFLLTQVPLMLSDVPGMFFLMLAVYACFVARDSARFLIVALAGVCVAAAALARYSSWLLLSVVPLVMLAGNAAPWRLVARNLLAVGVTALALVAVVLVPLRDVVFAQLALLWSYQAPALSRWGEGFASTFLFQIHPFTTLAAGASLAVAWRERDWRVLALLWPVALLLVLEVQRARYLLAVFPLVALAAAAGLRLLPGARLRTAVACCAATTGLVVNAMLYQPFLAATSAANLARAGALLDARGVAQVQVETARQPASDVNPAVAVPILDLYTEASIYYPYDAAAQQPPREVAISPVRFTWEYRNPDFYAQPPPAGAVAVFGALIYGTPAARPPVPATAGMSRLLPAATFAAVDEVYKFNTLVAVYELPPR